MKNSFLILLIVVSLLDNTYAQLNDTDAKIRYQQVEDFYNNGKLNIPTYALSLQLARDMGKWTPKVLYLNLKCAYKFYVDGINIPQNEIYAGLDLKANYNSFQMLVNRCDTFSALIDKATYPAEKWKEIQLIRDYFLVSAKEYEYQKDRTPQDAITFLNECAVKFPNKNIGSSSFYDQLSAPSQGTYIRFSIYDQILHIVVINKRASSTMNYRKSYNKVYRIQHLIDLSKTMEIVKIKTSGLPITTKVITGNQVDIDGTKKMNYYFHLVRDSYSKNFEFDKADTTYIPGQPLPNTWNNAEGTFDIFQFFNQNAPEFINENYSTRIEEAFQLLVDYFPKVKTTEPARKSKF